MSVRPRPFKGRESEWEVDIRTKLPDGKSYRKRVKAPDRCRSERAAREWGERLELELVRHGLPVAPEPPAPEPEPVPTLAELVPRFLVEYVQAERLKPSAASAVESICRVHLVPALGSKRLDVVDSADVQRLKASLASAGRTIKTSNNVLSVLATLLRWAAESKVIAVVPGAKFFTKPPVKDLEFFEREELDRLVKASLRVGAVAHLVVLLGADAGLRLGEIAALFWSDVDIARRQIRVQRSEWTGKLTADGPRVSYLGPTKSGKPRSLPMTTRLAEAVRGHQAVTRLRGERMLCRADGRPLSQKGVQYLVASAARRANLEGNVHKLRHTFGSLAAASGVPVMAIRDLMGHASLATTMRYMHLSPRALEAGIRVLECGEIRETGALELALGQKIEAPK